MRTLIAIPVYNEQKHLAQVLEQVVPYAHSENGSHDATVLVIDDGSTDASPALLAHFPVEVIRHATNRGYGRSMQAAFRWAAVDGFDWVVTLDCDEQHEPARIPDFLAAAARDDADVISGSRYLSLSDDNDVPPPDRRAINHRITVELNDRLGLTLTDGFCGFKAYRTDAVAKLSLSESGYAFPMQIRVEAVAHGLRIDELPVKLIYNDLNRSFGGPLNHASTREQHYREVMHEALRCRRNMLPERALEGVEPATACACHKS